MDCLLEGCQVIGFDYRYVYVNDAVVRHARKPREELVGHRMTAVFPGIEQTEMFSVLRRCMQEREPLRMDNEFVYPDGSSGWFDLRFEPTSEGVLVLSIDVSDRKRTELALARSRRALRTLSESNQALVRATDATRFPQDVCEIATGKSGYRCAWVGMRGPDGGLVSRGVAGVSDDEVTLLAEEALSRGTMVLRDGQVGIPFRVQGELAGVFLVRSDEPFEEEELRLLDELALDLAFGLEAMRTREIWRATFNAISDVVCVVGPGRDVVEINDAGCWVSGLTRDRIVGRKCFEVLLGADAPLPSCPCVQAEATRKPASCLHRTKGDVFELTAWPILGKEGRLEGMVHVGKDVTERTTAEDALRESERRLATLLDNLPGMVYRCKLDSRWTMEFVSRASRALTGYGPEELMGNARTSYAGLIHPADVDFVSREVRRAVDTGIPFALEYRIRDASGREKRVREKGRAVVGATGELALEGFIADVTQRHEAEEGVRRLAARLERLTEAVQALAAARDVGRVTAIACEAARELMAADGATILLREGEEWRYVDEDAISPLWKSRQVPASDRISGWVMRSGQPVVVPNVRLDDRLDQDMYRPTFVRGLAMVPMGSKDAMGAVGTYWAAPHAATPDDVRILQALADSTSIALENVRTLEGLRRSEDRYRTLVESLEDVVFSLDGQGRFLYVSGSIARYGYPPEEVIGRFFSAFVHPEDLPGLEASLRVTLAGDAEPYEFRTLDRQGNVRFVRTSSRAVTVGGKQIVSGVMVDVTEQRRVQKQLEMAQRLEAVGQLAGGIAHDFNNLLLVINTTAELAMDELSTSDPTRADLDEIRQAGQRAASLTRQLLAFSRRQVLAPKVIGLNDVVRGLEGMLHRLLDESIRIEFRLASALGHVRADPGQVEQVIVNLAVNARDAMPNGGTLAIETSSVVGSSEHGGIEPGQPYVRLSVEDSGVGMTQETARHIFEPFFTTKEFGKGTGLGLATVWGIVQQSGGSICVRSEPGQGTRFDVFFPRLGEHETPETQFDHPSAEGDGEIVLVVEDADAVRRLTERILRAVGYRVLCASNGEEALSSYGRPDVRVDLLLTDVVMPSMSGRQLADRMREVHPHLRVLYISGYTDDAIVHHGVLGPDTHFLSKPFVPSELRSKVRGILGGGSE
jgi:PAS domain S-box-containing protein